MAGYSATPLAHKLGARDGITVLLDNAPAGFALDAPTTTRLPRRLELALTFHHRQATLAKRLPALIERTTPAGTIWICWPKQAAVRRLGLDTDLAESDVRRIGLATGLVDVKVAAIDEVWSGLKFVRRLADRD